MIMQKEYKEIFVFTELPGVHCRMFRMFRKSDWVCSTLFHWRIKILSLTVSKPELKEKRETEDKNCSLCNLLDFPFLLGM